MNDFQDLGPNTRLLLTPATRAFLEEHRPPWWRMLLARLLPTHWRQRFLYPPRRVDIPQPPDVK